MPVSKEMSTAGDIYTRASSFFTHGHFYDFDDSGTLRTKRYFLNRGMAPDVGNLFTYPTLKIRSSLIPSAAK